ncbi:hypothetical protein DVH05_004961 [Phytophthora capsici]|nr:hypothetical protein DVH05_004961 [Phytophthora capsici]
MKCSKVDCGCSELNKTDPCSICSRPVHHLCSNDICGDEDLSKSYECLARYKGLDVGTTGSSTPVSSQGVSVSSQATELDAEDLTITEHEDTSAPTLGIPESVVHFRPRKARDKIWDVIHELQDRVTVKRKSFSHICLLCAETKTWKRALCTTVNTSNAKNHMIQAHPGHDLTSSVSNSPGCEVPDASDTEMSLLCGEEVSPQSEQSLVDSNLAKEADAVVDMWLDLRVEWGEVAKSQYKDAEKRSEVLGKLSMSQPNGKRSAFASI